MIATIRLYRKDLFPDFESSAKPIEDTPPSGFFKGTSPLPFPLLPYLLIYPSLSLLKAENIFPQFTFILFSYPSSLLYLSPSLPLSHKKDGICFYCHEILLDVGDLIQATLWRGDRTPFPSLLPIFFSFFSSHYTQTSRGGGGGRGGLNKEYQQATFAIITLLPLFHLFLFFFFFK